MRIREALKVFSGAQVSHPNVPAMRLQRALLVILGAARRQAELQEQELAQMDSQNTKD